MDFIHKRNLSSDNDQDDAEIDNILSMNPSQFYQQPSLLSHTITGQSGNEILSFVNKISSQPHNHLSFLTNSLSRQMSDFSQPNDQIYKSLKKKYNLLMSKAESKEGGIMSRTNSSLSNQSRPIQYRRVAEQSESGEEQQILQRNYEDCDDDIDIDFVDEESYLEEDEKDQSNQDSPLKYKRRYQRSDGVREYDDGSFNGKNGTDNLIDQEQIEGYMKLNPVEKLATFKKYKQTFMKQPSTIVRKFFCEILYDKIEEEKIIKTKYISKVVGFIMSSEDPFSHKYIIKMIDEKDFRQKKVRDVMRVISDDESCDRNSVTPYFSIYRTQKFKEDLDALLQLKDDEKKTQQENSILKDLLNRKNEIFNYEQSDEFKSLIEQIIVQKAQRFYNFSNSAKLIASFLLNLNLTPSVLIKYLLDSEKLQSMCNSAIDIIRVLSVNHKYDAPQSK